MSALVTSKSGVVRSDPSGKPDYLLVDLAMLERWAIHMTKNEQEKGRHSWRLGSTQEDWDRYRASAFRHFLAWVDGVEDGEDHAAALFFNVSGAEHTKKKLTEKGPNPWAFFTLEELGAVYRELARIRSETCREPESLGVPERSDSSGRSTNEIRRIFDIPVRVDERLLPGEFYLQGPDGVRHYGGFDE